MASAFSHILVSIAISKSYQKKLTNWKFWALGSICSIIPDADVISFTLGIPYDHFFGHRGFTHSLTFSFLLAILIMWVFYRKISFFSLRGLAYLSFFFLSTASHAVLDAMTTGGLGVAFFSPFDSARYFLPWRPIQVSPIGIENFMGERGIRVIQSEMCWIGIPCIIYMSLIWVIKKAKPNRPSF